MNYCFFITSAINVDNANPFLYGTNVPRTAFTASERLRQTVYSVKNIQLLCPTAKIFIVDISENYQEYQTQFDTFSNVTYISCEQVAPALANICRTHPSKGLCESLITLCFLQAVDIKLFDYIVKLSGRYFYTKFDSSWLNSNNTNQYLVKQPLFFDWKDQWNFPDMLKQNGKLPYCYTQTYAVGSKYFLDFHQSMQNISLFYLDNLAYANVDFESLFNYYVLDNNNIISIPWHCGGWNGSDGIYGEV